MKFTDKLQYLRFLVDKRGWKEQYVGIHETLYAKP